MATGRFAPSPTGELHLGNLRTALVAWLFARSAGDRFLVRMEDLDRAAVRVGAMDRQLADLAALGLDWDGPVLLQSTRAIAHRQALDDLTARGLTYPCYCSRREIREAVAAPHGLPADFAYPGTCRHLTPAEQARRAAEGRPPARRLRSPSGAAGPAIESFDDRIVGPVSGPVTDVVLERGDGTPAYNLAVVVDDAFQAVGEVVRGDDLLGTTPTQLHLATLLGFDRPAHAHVPLALGPTGARLAKRDGSVTLADLAAEGRRPRWVLGLIARSLDLAGPGETLTATQLIDRFDPARLPREAWVVRP